MCIGSQGQSLPCHCITNNMLRASLLLLMVCGAVHCNVFYDAYRAVVDGAEWFGRSIWELWDVNVMTPVLEAKRKMDLQKDWHSALLSQILP